MYKIIKLSNNTRFILKDDYLWIPEDPSNCDYKDYLKWIESGNTPEIIEEG